MVPIDVGTLSHDQTHRISRLFSERLARKQPDRLTTSASLSARDRRLFIDYLRNGRGTTGVGTFSPRARHGFPIAAPTPLLTQIVQNCIRVIAVGRRCV